MSPSVGKRALAFISYRRSDADAVAGRIKDRMATDLPSWDVFMDVTSIKPGAKFKEVIEETIARSSVFVALIGRDWLAGRRIDDPEDLVRREVQAALAANIRVIPVLLNDARMPTRRDVPADIAAITEFNAVELRHSRFDDDFANLVSAIAGEPHVVRRQGIPVSSIFWGALFGLVSTLSLLVIHFELTGKAASERIGEDGATLAVPAGVIIGSLVGYWRALRRSAGAK